MEQGSNLFYYIFPIVISIIALAGYKKPKTGFFIMIILLFFSMFRGDNVGNDTKNYMDAGRIQYRGGNLSVEFTAEYFMENFGSRTEIIDVALNRLVYHYDLTPRVIIWIYSLITVIVLYNSLRKVKVNTSIGLLIYVLSGLYYFSLTAARQMAAVSIVLYALVFVVSGSTNYVQLKRKFLLRSDFIHFIIFLFVAGMIHTSALFYIFIYPFLFLHINTKYVTLLISVVCLSSVLLNISPMSHIFSVVNLEYISRYLGLFDEGGRSLMGRLYDVPIYLFLIVIFKKGVKAKKTDVADNIYAIALVLMALFAQTSGLLARITYYLKVFICTYIPMVMIDNQRLRKGVLYVLFLFYVVLSIYGIGGWAVSSLTSGYYLMF